MELVRRGKRASGSAEVVCKRHGTPTQLRCVRCNKLICPRCLVQTPVGFMCADHEGAPVKRAEDLPLTSKYRPLGMRTPSQGSGLPVGLLLFPAMILLGPLLAALTGGSVLGVFLVPVIIILVMVLVFRRPGRP